MPRAKRPRGPQPNPDRLAVTRGFSISITGHQLAELKTNAERNRKTPAQIVIALLQKENIISPS